MGCGYPYLQPFSLLFESDQPLTNGDYPYISFEYVGEKTHFEGERGWPQRGANCTSLDFAFLFKRYDGKKQLVLGEWKYTEEYKSNKLPTKDNILQRRWNTYKEDFEIWRADNPNVPTYEHYFVEPFYQLMRQSVLADKMLKKLNFRRFSPFYRSNTDFKPKTRAG